MEIDHEKMKNWLDLYGLPMYTIHASGHASPHELKSIISGVNPGRVLFIHTERPHLYQRFISDLGIESIIPVEGQPVSIRRGSR
jgi:mRNA degradation ribonuclease J1/J2